MSQGGSGGSIPRSDSTSHDIPDSTGDRSSLTNMSMSGSEGGSGDGSVGSALQSPKHTAAERKSSLL